MNPIKVITDKLQRVAQFALRTRSRVIELEDRVELLEEKNKQIIVWMEYATSLLEKQHKASSAPQTSWGRIA